MQPAETHEHWVEWEGVELHNRGDRIILKRRRRVTYRVAAVYCAMCAVLLFPFALTLLPLIQAVGATTTSTVRAWMFVLIVVAMCTAAMWILNRVRRRKLIRNPWIILYNRRRRVCRLYGKAGQFDITPVSITADREWVPRPVSDERVRATVVRIACADMVEHRLVVVYGRAPVTEYVRRMSADLNKRHSIRMDGEGASLSYGDREGIP